MGTIYLHHQWYPLVICTICDNVSLILIIVFRNINVYKQINSANLKTIYHWYAIHSICKSSLHHSEDIEIPNNRLHFLQFTSEDSKLKILHAREPIEFMSCHLDLALCDLATCFTRHVCYLTDSSSSNINFKHLP